MKEIVVLAAIRLLGMLFYCKLFSSGTKYTLELKNLAKVKRLKYLKREQQMVKTLVEVIAE